MNTIYNPQMPKAYPGCVLSSCPLASNCLRNIAFQMLSDEPYLVSIVNPKQCTQDETCKNFRNSAPQRLALGFKSMQAQMIPSQYALFSETLINRFGRYNYFKMRKGEIPISLENQYFIKSILAKVGAPETCDFDTYEMQTCW